MHTLRRSHSSAHHRVIASGAIPCCRGSCCCRLWAAHPRMNSHDRGRLGTCVCGWVVVGALAQGRVVVLWVDARQVRGGNGNECAGAGRPDIWHVWPQPATSPLLGAGHTAPHSPANRLPLAPTDARGHWATCPRVAAVVCGGASHGRNLWVHSESTQTNPTKPHTLNDCEPTRLCTAWNLVHSKAAVTLASHQER
jgi:hypothetical protein